MISNYEDELHTLQLAMERNSSYFVRLKFLDVSRRLRLAKPLLQPIADAVYPFFPDSTLFPNDFVVEISAASPVADDDDANGGGGEGADDDGDGVDPAEGGEQDPEKVQTLSFVDIFDFE